MNSARLTEEVWPNHGHGPFFKRLEQSILFDCINKFFETEQQTYFHERGAHSFQDDHIFTSHDLSTRQPFLIYFVLTQRSMFHLARHLRRSQTSSNESLIVYSDILNRVFNWLQRTPDETINWLMTNHITPNPAAWKELKTQLKEYMGTLQARGLAPKTIRLRYTAVKTWLKISDIPIPHIATSKNRVIYYDRAPSPKEISKLMKVADLRAKVLITMLALGGFREHTSRLKYRHVKHDLEKGITPLHIHIESEISKGKYAGYDTFIGHEGIEYLKLYLNYRRRGSYTGKIPPRNS